MKNKEEKQNMAIDLFDFIKDSPTAFHTVNTVARKLSAAGYIELKENEPMNIILGGRYYITRDDSSIISFKIGKNISCPVFRVAASHSDAPAFKVKEMSEVTVKDEYIQLNTEGYGGMICSTWMDRPLSLAGRVVVKEGNAFATKLINFDRDLVLIPSLAIHMNRKVNEGIEYNKQIDMLPLFGAKKEECVSLKELIASELGIKEKDIYGQDIFLYNRMEGSVWGASYEYISAPRLDDLMCAFASLSGFMNSNNEEVISVYACFDNEEVGSSTLNGAGSSFFADTIERISHGLGYSSEEYHIGLADSLMLSEDNGHAVHPNHPEKTDSNNCVYMNGGIVIKSHAGAKYSTDAVGMAICRDICQVNDIPMQFYSNRSDEAGGSTLGNIASCRVPIRTIDIGLAQLAMHSSYETAGALDTDWMIAFNEAFYEY